MMRGLDADTVARRVRELPALPAALNRVLGALRDEQLRSDGLAALIEQDQALCARTLRLANSAFYGLQGRVGSVHDAIRLLGLRTVANLLTAATLAGQAGLARCPGFDFRLYWRHSVAVSIAAREIARTCGHDADEACVTGLLHDVGRLALAAYFPAELSAALDLAHAADLDPTAAERAVLGLDHGRVGAMVAAHWRLPAELVQAIGHHHAPPPNGTCRTGWLVDTVHVADAVAHALDLAGDPNEAVPAMSLDSWTRLNAVPLDSARLFAAVQTGVAAVAAALQV
jgi:putative nucleotidyltransferase with HDIG domain